VVGYLAGSDEQVAANVKEGQTFVPGPYEPASLVRNRPKPPEPAEDFTWNDVTARWQLTQEAEGRRLTESATRVRIEALERSAVRWLIDAALGDKDALDRLGEIKARIDKETTRE